MIDGDEEKMNAGEITVHEDAELATPDAESAAKPPRRGKWGGRWSFVVASIGSAIGLGNFWRFPLLAYKWGGGAFFIPYLLALVVVGIPLLQLEFALGEVFRRAATQAFARLHPRFAGVGLAGAVISLGIVGYYCAILGWSNVMFVESWYKDMPWSIRGLTGADVISVPSDHFFNDVVRVSTDLSVTVSIASLVFAGAFFQWMCIFIILYKGQAFISKAVWIMVLLPVLMLLVLLIVGATLPGASLGIEQYIGTWDMSLLAEGDMWVDAFTQIFFSLGVGTGVLPAFSSMNPMHQNVVQDAVIVAACNSCFSFLAGFAVFSVVGYLSHESGISIEDLHEQDLLGGPNLAFIAYPSGLSLVDGYAANILTAAFFLTFFMLGVSSAYAFVESGIRNFRETPLLADFSRTQLVILFTAVGGCTTVLYASDIGFYLLDVADAYIATFGLTVVGFLEVFVAGWVYEKPTAVARVGAFPVLFFDVMFWAGFALFTGLSLGLGHVESLSRSAAIGIAFGVGITFMIVGVAVALPLAAREAGSTRKGAYYLFFHGPDTLRHALNDAICAGSGEHNWRLSWTWVVLVKFVMPPLMLLLIGINVETLAAKGGYGGFGPGYQAFGTFLLMIVVGLCAMGLALPHWFRDVHAAFAPIDSKVP